MGRFPEGEHDVLDSGDMPRRAPGYSSSTASAVEFPFLGREREMDALRGFLDQAEKGRGNLVFVTGEAGVGKTTLVGEVSKLAKARGFTCLTVKCPKGGSLFPYSVWVELLRGYLSTVSVRDFFELCGNLSGRILNFLPELGTLDKGGDSPGMSQSQGRSAYQLALSSQVQVFDAMTQFFLRMSSRSPVLLVLDDFQWSDNASLDLLQYISSGTFRDRPLLFLCAFRDTSLEQENPRLRLLLSDLPSSESLNVTIHLERFDRVESTRLIQSAFGPQRPDDDVGRVLYRKSGGNPFFMKEMLRLMVSRGNLTKGPDGQWRLAENWTVDIPSSAKDVVRQRMAYLDNDTEEALMIGAFVGETFGLQVLSRVSGFDEGERLPRLMEKGVALGLIEEKPDRRGELEYAFTDEVVMDVLVEKIGKERSRSYHLAVARALEEVYVDAVNEHAPELAFHYQEGGMLEKCLEYSVRAGDHASRAMAPRDAANQFETALACLGEMKNYEGKVSRGQLLESLGRELWTSGETTEACRRWVEAVRIYEESKDDERAGILHCRIGYYYTGIVYKDDEAFEEYRKSLECLSRLPPGPALALLYHHLAEWYFFHGEPKQARENAERAISIAKETSYHLVEAAAHAMIGASSPIGDGENALRHLQYVEQFDMKYWRSVYDPRYNIGLTVARPYWWLAGFGYKTIKSDCQRAKDLFLMAKAYSEEFGRTHSNGWARMMLANRAYLPLGDWASARAELAYITHQRWISDPHVLRGAVLAGLGTLDLLEGNLEEAEKLLLESHSLLQRGAMGIYNAVSDCHASLGRLYLAKGDNRRAEVFLKEGYRIMKKGDLSVGSAFPLAVCAAYLVESCLGQGKVTEARVYAEELGNIARVAKWDWANAYWLRASGEIASDAEEWQEAQECYQNSIECWKRLGYPYDLAVTYRKLAAVHQEKGETELANQALDTALDLFKRLGAKLDAQSIVSMRSTNEEHQDALAVVRLTRVGGERSRLIFGYLSDAFIDDYYAKRLSSEVCGWRSFVEIARSTGLHASTFYHAESGKSAFAELARSGLIESRLFLRQRGRGGSITRIRIAFDREEIKQYISKKARTKTRGAAR